jgi:regulation of enolase protein 1 (concanavalin A-like superfamily)
VPTPPAGATIEKLVDDVDRRQRLRQHCGLLIGSVLLLIGFSNVNHSEGGFVALLAGALVLTLTARIKQRWEVPYRGHRIRFENSCLFGERLLIDGEVAARGGFCGRRELRGPIRQGEAAGAEVMVLIEAGLMRYRCRIFVEHPAPRPRPEAAPPAAAPARSRRRRVLLWVLLAVPLLLVLCCLLPIAVVRESRSVPRPARIVPKAKPARPRPGPAGWGEIIDPRGDSRLVMDQGLLSVTIPAGPLHHLHSLYNLDAPRLVQEVVGDFRVQVRVLPFAPPPKNSAAAPGQASFRAAGLLVWQDERNFLRLERGAVDVSKEKTAFIQAQRFINDGQVAAERPWPEEQGISYYQIERRGKNLHLRLSKDGQTWKDWKTIDDLPLPHRVKVGITAINTTNREFTAQFEKFEVMLSLIGGREPEE